MDEEQTVELLKSQFDRCRRVLAAIGDETRQLILVALATDSCDGMRVGDITKGTHLSRPAVSHHLKILLDAEVAGVRKEGTKNYYYLILGGEWQTLVSLINAIEELRTADEEGA